MKMNALRLVGIVLVLTLAGFGAPAHADDKVVDIVADTLVAYEKVRGLVFSVELPKTAPIAAFRADVVARLPENKRDLADRMIVRTSDDDIDQPRLSMDQKPGLRVNDVSCPWEVRLADPVFTASGPSQILLGSNDIAPVSDKASFQIVLRGALGMAYYAFGETKEGHIRDLAMATRSAVVIDSQAKRETIVLIEAANPVEKLEDIRRNLAGATGLARKNLGIEKSLITILSSSRGIGSNVLVIGKSMVDDGVTEKTKIAEAMPVDSEYKKCDIVFERRPELLNRYILTTKLQ